MRRASAFTPLRLPPGPARAEDVNRNLDEIRRLSQAMIVEYRDLSDESGGDVLAGSFNYDAIRATIADVGDVANCYGILTSRDGGQGQFVVRSGVATDNNGTILSSPALAAAGKYWERIDDGPIKPSMFGAKAISADVTTELLAACAAAAARENNVVVIDKSYAIATTGQTIAAGITLRFERGGKFRGAGITGGTALKVYAKIDAPADQEIFDKASLTDGPPWLYDVPVVHPKWFGMVGDNSADDTKPIQNAIDVGIYFAKTEIYFPNGRAKTTDTIHIGYGVTGLFSCKIRTAGPAFRCENGFPGFAILPTFNDRPCVNVQGIFNSSIEGLAVRGQMFSWIQANNLGYPYGVAVGADPLLDDTDVANWIDTSFPASASSRYAPYVGISTDAYCGPQPGVSYPAVTYPTFTAVLFNGGVAVPQYNKAQCSTVRFRDTYVGGFYVGVAHQPSDYDGNGDYLSFDNTYIEYSAYGSSIGNSQSITYNFNDSQMSRVFCCFTSTLNGKQIGKFGGHIRNFVCFAGIQLVDFGIISGPVKINGHAENIYRIGSVFAGSPFAVDFDGFEFLFTMQQVERGISANVLDGMASSSSTVSFRRCTFIPGPGQGVISFNHDAIFEDCYTYFDARTNPYEQFAHNALAGGLVVPQLRPQKTTLQFQAFNLDTGVINSSVKNTDVWRAGNRDTCIPLYAKTVQPTDEDYPDNLRGPLLNRNRGIAKIAASVVITFSNRTMQMVFAARADWQFYQDGPLPGDVLWDGDTQTVFFVRSRIGLTVLAEAQNNYIETGPGTYAFIDTIPTNNAQSLYLLNSRIYTTRNYLRGDSAAASAILTNCARDDGNALYDADIAVGDYVLCEPTRDSRFDSSVSLITARSQAAGTITINGSTGMRTETRKRIEFFIRQPPANI